MRIEVDINAAAMEETLRKLAAAMDTTEILDEAGALLLNRIRTRFLRKTDPDLLPWPPSEAGRKREAKGGTGTLFDTGNLWRSIQLAGTGPDERSILTDVYYSIFHEEGTELLPIRAFMGFNEADAELVNKLIIKRLRNAVR
jgi:phage gpG-like protein